MPEERKGTKNIVICCDGTGNQFNDCNSNVVKLYTALVINNEQVGYYHPGVGTMGAPDRKTRVGKGWSRIEGLAFGSGFMDNVEDAYRYLMDRYNDGDQIYLFGFSRGSYTIRALAGILHAYGLLCRGNEGHIPYVLRMFMDDVQKARSNNEKTISVQEPFKQTFSHNVTVRFVGLWDTVSSIGWIYAPLKLVYTAQNPIIQTGRHAVSIDERRCFYQDNLWGPSLPHGQTPSLSQPQDILQVWFAGVHSDVGGSYRQCESALANKALKWLLDEALASGVKTDADRVRMIVGEPTQGSYAAADLYVQPSEPGIVHQSLHGPWWLLEFLPHRYYDDNEGKKRWRIPLGRPRKLPIGSLLHPSVFKRLTDRTCNYRPKNLDIRNIEPPEGGASPTFTYLPTDNGGLYRYNPKSHAFARKVKMLRVAGALAIGIIIALRALTRIREES